MRTNVRTLGVGVLDADFSVLDYHNSENVSDVGQTAVWINDDLHLSIVFFQIVFLWRILVELGFLY